jgi:G3E family GTPase
LIEVAKLARQGGFDYLVIESTGVGEPLPVAETFTFDAEGMPLDSVARLDTMVTVVDAHNFLMDLDSMDDLLDRKWETDAEDDRDISTLLVDQIEFANVILVNKCDMVTKEEREKVISILRQLNPEARILETTHSAVDLKDVLNTGLFSMEKAEKVRHVRILTMVMSCCVIFEVQAPGWLKALRGEHVPETEEYGISSFVFRSNRPFHPARLAKLLFSEAFSVGAAHASKATASSSSGADGAPPSGTESDDDSDSDVDEISEDLPACTSEALDGRYGFCVRSKGTAWLAGAATEANAFAGDWSHSGRLVALTPSSMWFAAVDRSLWPSDDAPEVWDSTPGVGDRHTEVVIIGMGLKPAEFRAALDGCVLTVEEFASGPDGWAAFPNPLWGSTDWGELRDSVLRPEEECEPRQCSDDEREDYEQSEGGVAKDDE